MNTDRAAIGSMHHLQQLLTAVSIVRGSGTALRVIGRFTPAGEVRSASRVPVELRWQACAELLQELGGLPIGGAPQPAPAARRSRAA